MSTIHDLFDEVEKLPPSTKWELVKRLLHSLEMAQTGETIQDDWHQFLSETYASLRDTPLEHFPQGDHSI